MKTDRSARPATEAAAEFDRQSRAGTPKLVRHNGSIVTLSELSADEIGAAMNDEQREAFAQECGVSMPKLRQQGPRTRIQAVASAVATDKACKGKAELALQMLADDELAGVPASGLVKLLQAGGASDGSVNAQQEMRQAIARSQGIQPPSPAASTAASKAASAAAWDRAIGSLNGGQA
ncbi:MAG: hypothetical protein JY451_01700 [Erythrobacter sp.]|nr:MAG: hypothetical protein JY451_01700 [Erythrobacter sp.]